MVVISAVCPLALSPYGQIQRVDYWLKLHMPADTPTASGMAFEMGGECQVSISATTQMEYDALQALRPQIVELVSDVEGMEVAITLSPDAQPWRPYG